MTTQDHTLTETTLLIEQLIMGHKFVISNRKVNIIVHPPLLQIHTAINKWIKKQK